ncbi:MAG: hypothetical protein HZY75_07250 [Nocardioidaceae bacterium]|nr:MAG: hypothetical protein HZY75_07250 [Nocardioidaceae bacterium]
MWTSDGTAEGTLMVKDIYPDSLEWPRDEPPKYLAAMGDRLFFAADDGVHGHELWTSDGTAEGTVMVKDIHPDGSDSSSPKGLTAVGNRLFFTADDGVHGDELWVSDGTEQGTAMVKDIRPGSADGGLALRLSWASCSSSSPTTECMMLSRGSPTAQPRAP